ncbi:hypothetical protein ACIDI_131c00060 [Acidiphilium sp. JA12-A1]|nr:hypothetical protein ACIDI_131c00060 [Acidiphilium sp. JA12-A1]
MSVSSRASGLLAFILGVFRSTNHYSRLYWTRTAGFDATPGGRDPIALADFCEDLKRGTPTGLLDSGISPSSAPSRN